MKVYHGTTLNNVRNILNREKYKESVWSCSENDEFIYFWEEQNYIKVCGLEDEDPEFVREKCINDAFDSASIQAVLDQTVNKLYVLEIEIPKKYESLIQPDYSVTNNNGAVCIDIKDFNVNWIKNVLEIEHNMYSNLLTVSNLLNNDYFNKEKISDDLYQMATEIANHSVDFSFLYDIQMEKISNAKEYSLKELSKQYPDLQKTQFFIELKQKEIDKKLKERNKINKMVNMSKTQQPIISKNKKHNL